MTPPIEQLREILHSAGYTIHLWLYPASVSICLSKDNSTVMAPTNYPNERSALEHAVAYYRGLQ